VIARAPTASVAVLERAVCHRELEEWKEALEDLDRVDQIDPELDAAARELDHPSGLTMMRGSIHCMAGRATEAIAAFDRALADAPGSLEGLVSRSYAHALAGSGAAALRDAEEALRLHPDAEQAREAHEDAVALNARLAAAKAHELTRGRAAHHGARDRLEAALRRLGAYDAQREAVLRQFGSGEPVWVCRFSRPGEVFRSVVLLLTTEQFVWCRETMWSSPQSGHHRWSDVVRVDTAKFRGVNFELHSGTTLTFDDPGTGVDLTEGRRRFSGGAHGIAVELHRKAAMA